MKKNNKKAHPQKRGRAKVKSQKSDGYSFKQFSIEICIRTVANFISDLIPHW
ncbi:hypothetical protein [Rummeliibacillus sp. TYF005]|uniref:hypothetical protein n=1 Tax=Rummeliibacillus sp. TYF005 TaxID=2058214 RepID=UPI0013DE45CC|nr:hypothetical protein [Rummeliibacillus sp. TYF005]